MLAAAWRTSGVFVSPMRIFFWFKIVATANPLLTIIPSSKARVMMCRAADNFFSLSKGTSLASKAWAAIEIAFQNVSFVK